MINNDNLKDFGYDSTVSLYHIDIYDSPRRLKILFGDVKFVVTGGKQSRMKSMAEMMQKLIGEDSSEPLTDYSSAGGRFSMFKVEKVLFLSHGMGIPSIMIALHEVAKLLHFAGVRDPIFIRIGTCGGLGLEPGTIVVTDKCYDAKLNDYMETVICGNPVKRLAILDRDLSDNFLHFVENVLGSDRKVEVLKANTMCTNDFYEEQGRMDGAINEVDKKMRNEFFEKLMKEYKIRNIEMESLAFGAFCHKLNIKGLVTAVTLIDRTVSDEMTLSGETYEGFQVVLMELVLRFIIAGAK